MKAKIIIAVLLAVIALQVAWIPALQQKVQLAGYGLLEPFDRRPVQRVLFIGNSRTFYHNMPLMVRKIADSAGSAAQYRIAMQAAPGAYLQDHWRSEKTRQRIRQGWDHVFVQPASAEQLYPNEQRNFMQYGSLLLTDVKAHSRHAALIRMWTYEKSFYQAGMQQKHDADIQHYTTLLAQRHRAGIVDAAAAWRIAGQRGLPFSLYDPGDTNHQSVAGSYLLALIVYRHLTEGASLHMVTYHPDGITAQQAAMLRNIAQAVPLFIQK